MPSICFIRAASSMLATTEAMTSLFHSVGKIAGMRRRFFPISYDELMRIMDQDKDLSVKALSDIPIGHKLAIKALKNADTVIKYGVDIGRTIAPIAVGEHLHVHNVKTKRW